MGMWLDEKYYMVFPTLLEALLQTLLGHVTVAQAVDAALGLNDGALSAPLQEERALVQPLGEAHRADIGGVTQADFGAKAFLTLGSPLHLPPQAGGEDSFEPEYQHPEVLVLDPVLRQ